MRRALVLGVTALLLATGCSTDPGPGATAGGLPDTLRVGLIPNIAPEAQRAKYQPFADYLQRRLGTKVELFVAADYAGVVAALAGGRIDLAYLGGLTYAQAEQQVALTSIVAPPPTSMIGSVGPAPASASSSSEIADAGWSADPHRVPGPIRTVPMSRTRTSMPHSPTPHPVGSDAHLLRNAGGFEPGA